MSKIWKYAGNCNKRFKERLLLLKNIREKSPENNDLAERIRKEREKDIPSYSWKISEEKSL
jgi:hypothetical protein